MQSLFGCKKTRHNFDHLKYWLTKFSKFGANFASFCHFVLAEKLQKTAKKTDQKRNFASMWPVHQEDNFVMLITLIQINGSNRHHLLSKQLLLNINGLEINLHVLVKRSHQKNLLYRLKSRLQSNYYYNWRCWKYRV